MALGVKPGERVAVWATNVPNGWCCNSRWPRSAPSSSRSTRRSEGRRSTTCSARAGPPRSSRSAGSGTSTTFDVLRDVGALGGGYAALERIIFVGADPPSGTIPYDELHAQARRISEDRLAARERDVTLDTVINMQYTSGTTGFPKGVSLSSRNIVNNGYWLGVGLGFTPRDRLCLCVPLFHCFGCVIGVLGALHARRVPLSGRILRPAAGARDRRARALHGALRRADDVPRRAGASASSRRFDLVVAADGDHGGRAVPGSADAAGHRRHAPSAR